MNMAEACALANEIEATTGYLVVAIGRFQILSDLLSSSEPYPWCLTVIACNSRGETPAKICSHSDWQSYRIMTSDPKPRPVAAIAKRRDEVHTRQPTLF